MCWSNPCDHGDDGHPIEVYVASGVPIHMGYVYVGRPIPSELWLVTFLNCGLDNMDRTVPNVNKLHWAWLFSHPK